MEEVRQFGTINPIGSKPRLRARTYALINRSSGARTFVRLGPQHIKNGWITLTRPRNRDRKPVTLSIPVLPEVEGRFSDATSTGNLAFLVHGLPGNTFNLQGFVNWFRQAMRRGWG